MAGRWNRLGDPEVAKSVAELYVKGISYQEMADEFDVSRGTIATWVKDPRVQAHARRMAVERVQRISRKIDGEIEARLEYIDTWALDEVLKVRKEFLERPLKIGAGEDADLGAATNEISDAMDKNPGVTEELLKLLEKAKPAKS